MSRKETTDAELEQELDELEKMPLDELQAFWLIHWGYVPNLRSVTLMRHLIAWRLQAAFYGGLDSRTAALLRSKRMPDAALLIPGTRLVREYRGVLHEVEVGHDNYRYAGREFRSLSQLATEITGTHWNGPRFFGLRQEAQMS